MAKLSVGVIGAGSIGNAHMTGYAAAPKMVTIRAICDPTPKRLREMGKKFGVSDDHLYSDHCDMLNNEKLDIVSVCTPNAFHFEHAAESIGRGINTLVEKPMVLTNEHARELKKIAARKKPKTMVAFSNRFVTMNIAGKKLLNQGKIGAPFMIRVRYAHGGPYPGWAQGDWFYNPRIAGGGALLDMGIHAIDICNYFIGPIKSVSAQIKTLRKDIAVDDNAVMVVDFGPKNCLGYIEVGWTSGPGFVGVEIYGDKGTLVLDLNGPAKVIKGVRNPDGSLKAVEEKIKVPAGPSHWALQMQSWINYCAGKPTATDIPGLEEGTVSLAVALAAMESSRTGKRMSLR